MYYLIYLLCIKHINRWCSLQSLKYFIWPRSLFVAFGLRKNANQISMIFGKDIDCVIGMHIDIFYCQPCMLTMGLESQTKLSFNSYFCFLLDFFRLVTE